MPCTVRQASGLLEAAVESESRRCFVPPFRIYCNPKVMSKQRICLYLQWVIVFLISMLAVVYSHALEFSWLDSNNMPISPIYMVWFQPDQIEKPHHYKQHLYATYGLVLHLVNTLPFN